MLRGHDAAELARVPVEGSVTCRPSTFGPAGEVLSGAPPDAAFACECAHGQFERPPPGVLPRTPAGWTATAAAPRLLILTVATHREPFINLLERSVARLGPGFGLLVVGQGGTFHGYGYKLQAVLRGLKRWRKEYDLILFTDSFDSAVLAHPSELVERFLRIGARVLVSGELNLWPEPHLRPLLEAQHPDPAPTYPFPNSGGYMGYTEDVIRLLGEVCAVQAKSQCVDDQGELIQALAADPSAFKVDHEAAFFQTLFNVPHTDILVQGTGIRNNRTGSRPCVVHSNGWDKSFFLRIAREAGLMTAAEHRGAVDVHDSLVAKTKVLQKREHAINTRCAVFNPNPVVEPGVNVVESYGLLSEQKALKQRLLAANAGFFRRKEQLFEVQEFLGFCPELEPHDGLTALGGSSTMVLPHDFASTGFRIFIYPLPPAAEAKLPAVYRELRAALRAHPNRTLDPREAALLVPGTDVSCWCESCLGNRPKQRMAEESRAVSSELASLEHWNGGGSLLTIPPWPPYPLTPNPSHKVGIICSSSSLTHPAPHTTLALHRLRAWACQSFTTERGWTCKLPSRPHCTADASAHSAPQVNATVRDGAILRGAAAPSSVEA